jgi:hypothetical protein
MVALGENGHRIHMRLFEGRDEIGRIEVGADAANMLGCVEIEVDLAVAQRLVGTGIGHSLAPVRVCDPAAN